MDKNETLNITMVELEVAAVGLKANAESQELIVLLINDNDECV